MTSNFFVYDNVFPEKEFKKISDEIIGIQKIPWFYSDTVSGIEVEKNCYFTHLFYTYINGKLTVSDWFYLVQPILDVINCKSLIRVKGNLYPRTDNLQHHKDHKDFTFLHNAAIFYLNTNNGFTILDGKHKIESIENRLLIFDPSILHHSTNCTDKQFRANINFNYF